MAVKLPPIGGADAGRRTPSSPSRAETKDTTAEENTSERSPSPELSCGSPSPAIKSTELGELQKTTASTATGSTAVTTSTESEAADAADDKDKSVKRGGLAVPACTKFTRRSLTIECKINIDALKDGDDEHVFERRAHPALQALASQPANRRVLVSVNGRKTNEKDVFQPYFSQKAMNFDGSAQTGRFQHNVGVMCQRGFKPDQPNQDDFAVLGGQDWLLFGVFDGHGPTGHSVSNHVQEHLPKQILQRIFASDAEWKSTLASSFEAEVCQLEKDMSEGAHSSGTTCSVGFLDCETLGDSAMRLRCGHVGDSSVIYAKKSSETQNRWETTLLTDPHKPERDDEAQRIALAGGQIQLSDEPDCPARLVCDTYDLAMSRSLGDFQGRPHGLSAEPEISEEILLDDKNGAEHIILACSDGIWDVIQPQQAVQIVSKFKAEEVQKAAEKLVQKAQVRWQQQTGDCVDDITVILIRPIFGPLSEVEEDDTSISRLSKNWRSTDDQMDDPETVKQKNIRLKEINKSRAKTKS